LLEPLQAYLAIACRLIRYVRNVVIWKNVTWPFGSTLVCLVLAVVSLFIPWFFLIKWTSRIVVWSVLGPWMRIVDIFIYTPMENMTEEEHVKRKEAAKMLKEKYLAEAVEKRVSIVSELGKRDNMNRTKVKQLRIAFILSAWAMLARSSPASSH
jgi:hypothetical protein